MLHDFFYCKGFAGIFFLKSSIPAHPTLLLSQAQRSNGPLLYLFTKQEIKLVWPNALFLRFAKKSCSCPVVLKRNFLKVVLFVLTLSPVSSFFSFTINNRADQKFFENSFFLFSHLLSRSDVSQEKNTSDTV